MDTIKVVIVDDDLNWLKEMKKFLEKEKDIEVTGTAANSEDAVKLAVDTNVDVILMDINLTENKYDGIYTALEINELKKAKIIMLTSMGEEEVIADSFKAGAVNFIKKDSYRDIPGAIRATFLDSSPIEVILKDYVRLKENEQLEILSSAEKDIFLLMKDGYSQSQIGGKLFKSTSTIKKQVGSILEKLGVSNSKGAIWKVKMKGLQKYK